ncbi:VOC family protein [Microbacterium sp. NPDC091313]
MTDDARIISSAEFHRAPGVADWRVVSSGVTALFTASSMREATQLVAPIADAAERFDVLPDVDLRPEAVVVRVPPWAHGGIPAATPGFAAAVSEAAAACGLRADPSAIRSLSIYVAQHSEVDVRPFFLAALGYVPVGETDAIDALRIAPDLAFNPLTGDSPRRGRTHLDVFVPASEAQARVDAALAAGGRLVDDSQAPAFWTLASPDNHGVDIASWLDTDG